MPVVPPDPWKLAQVNVTLFDALTAAIERGEIAISAEERAALEACREDVEHWRQQLASGDL